MQSRNKSSLLPFEQIHFKSVQIIDRQVTKMRKKILGEKKNHIHALNYSVISLFRSLFLLFLMLHSHLIINRICVTMSAIVSFSRSLVFFNNSTLWLTYHRRYLIKIYVKKLRCIYFSSDVLFCFLHLSLSKMRKKLP